VVSIEDVTTAGTSVRESVPLIRGCAGVEVVGLVVSVDRMERGAGAKSALAELRDEFGFAAFSIVNIDEIVGYMHNREVDGEVVLSDGIMERIREYRREYGCS
jgi:orotate phosphoribosyltransferase